MPVVEVAVPALGRLPLGAVDRRRVPDVDVLELRPHAEVGVRDVEQARVESKSKPGVVEPELDLVRVLAHDELLAGSSSQRRFSALLLTRELALGVRDERRRLGLEITPRLRIGDELREGNDGVALVAQASENLPLRRVERGRLLRIAAPCPAVAEHAVLQLVGRNDATTLDRAGNPDRKS